MRSAAAPSSFADGPSARRRAASLLLALAANALLLLMLFTLAPLVTKLPERPRLTTFALAPEPGAAPTPARAAPVRKKAGGGAPTKAPATVPVPPKQPEPAERRPVHLDMIEVTPDVFAAADIAKLHARSAEASPAGASAEAGTAGDSASAEGVGRAPGGERLYNAEWYREPTDAELAFYLQKRSARTGWGVIACRTIANYRVDDCQNLAESPAGSGLAEAVRQAAWQFRVMPPRIGVRRIVGAWVRIRIDYSERAAK